MSMTREVTIISLKHMKNSENGNPRYKIWTTGHSQGLTTPVDAGWVYAIHSGMVGKKAIVETQGTKITRLEIL